MSTAELLIQAITIVGTAAFALSAVLAALDKKVDIFTVVVLGLMTAIGGGTIRDWTLNVPVFWSVDIYYAVIGVVASLFGFLFFPLIQMKRVNRIYLYVDAIAASLFAIQGTDKAWNLGFGLPLAPIFLGVITAIGGGIVRDVLLEKPSLLLSKELYAIPVTLGCMVYTMFLIFIPQHSETGAVISVCFSVYLRHLSISRQISVPEWAILGRKTE
ncbi:trimeric intracellular cation channel family protein [Photobacterium sp. BZF1]|uniref:trimeric intracellular cation channel family protein n=1 Tax=Photobacterium sp. BZF1 TaxID=1904457 RepID=UPI001653657F|nr:trimeric intracellular cation channel family protein [Photobacterium sp. BZF1]MBC7006142.1 trimeric intracellular cation channel family protein [Photobacterium sp. BZF1]